jgi:DNA modification methylase
LGSLENEIVLDPFLGSGTTAIACEELKRKWIGIEQDERWCEVAAKRIEKENQQLRLC